MRVLNIASNIDIATLYLILLYALVNGDRDEVLKITEFAKNAVNNFYTDHVSIDKWTLLFEHSARKTVRILRNLPKLIDNVIEISEQSYIRRFISDIMIPNTSTDVISKKFTEINEWALSRISSYDLGQIILDLGYTDSELTYFGELEQFYSDRSQPHNGRINAVLRSGIVEYALKNGGKKRLVQLKYSSREIKDLIDGDITAKNAIADNINLMETKQNYTEPSPYDRKIYRFLITKGQDPDWVINFLSWFPVRRYSKQFYYDTVIRLADIGYSEAAKQVYNKYIEIGGKKDFAV